MQRKKIALSIALALGLAQNSAHAQSVGIIEYDELDGSNGFRFDGIQTYAQSGYAVSSAGDINGDGFDDIMIGTRDTIHTYVVFGKDAPFDAAQDLNILDGSNGFSLQGSLRGLAQSAAGDVNNDGIDDLLIGGRDSSYVVYGKLGAFSANLNLNTLDGSNGFRLDATSGERFGYAVSNAGDVNGDGIDDLIIGGRGISSYVVFGQDTPFTAVMNLSTLDGTNGFRIDGESAFDNFGMAMSTAGDVNGDGLDDLIIGAPVAGPNGNQSGSSYVIFGTESTIPNPFNLSTINGTNGFRLDGVAEYDESGYAVSTAGDINGDGFDDLLIGAKGASPNGNGTGSSYVVFGKSTPFTATLNLSSLDGTNGFRLDGEANLSSARSVSSAGDINGDGFDDIMIGAMRFDPNAVYAGESPVSGMSYVMFGKDSPFDATQDLTTINGANGFRFHSAKVGALSGGIFLALPDTVSAAGDVNGDGFDDLLIGASSTFPNGNLSGSSYVVFGPYALSPLINFDQKLVDFGDTLLGTNSDLSTLTLSNPGIGPILIDGITQTNPAFAIIGSDCGTLPIFILPNESCMMNLQFTPQAAGITFTNLSFSSTAATSPDAVALTGNGVLLPAVSLQADPLVFMDTPLGNSSTETLTVENIGPSSLLEPSAVTIQGTDAADFSIAMNNCQGAQLTTNQTCDIEISFTPTVAGTREAMLQLDSNAPSSPDFVELIGSSDVIFKSGFE